eukprot:gene15269-16845_t
MEIAQFDDENYLMQESRAPTVVANPNKKYSIVCCINSWKCPKFIQRIKNVLGKIFTKLWNIYIAANTRSWSAILLLLLVIGVNIALFFVAVIKHPVQVDYSLTAFEVPDHKASKKLEALIAAKHDQSRAREEDNAKKQQRHTRDTNPEVVLSSQFRQKWKLDIIYLAKDGNVFTDDKLEYIHKIEKKLLKDEKFKDFCWKTKKAYNDAELRKNGHGCMPPNSLIDFFFRTNLFDGQGGKLSDIKITLDFLLTKLSTFWYVDESFGADNRKSKFMRSQVDFGIPLKGYTLEADSVKKQHEIFKNFLVKFVKQLGTASSDQVTVLYGSPEIYDYEIKSTFYHDVLLAAISLGLVMILLFLLTSFSLWLTLFGVLTFVFSIPLAYFSYRVLLGVKTIGILTGTTVFVIIGIGVDDVFVFINVYKQAWHLKDPKERMKHSIATAAKATFFTSFTTAAAFGANILSKVPAVHDFGLFTCILVMTCWLMVLLLMPAAIFLWQRWLVKCETCICCRKQTSDGTENLMEREDFDVAFHPTRHDNRHDYELSSIDTEPTSTSSDSHDNTDRHDNTPECCTVINLLTKFMAKFIATPVIKGRFIVIALFLAITAGSIGVVTRLKTASGRPELFASNSNLQMSLNMKTNLSSESVGCSGCTEILDHVYPGVTSHHQPLVRRNVDTGDSGPILESLVRRNVDTGDSGPILESLVRRNVGNGTLNSESLLKESKSKNDAKLRGSAEERRLGRQREHETQGSTEHTAVTTSRSLPARTTTTVKPTTRPLCPKPCTPVKRPVLDKNAMVFVVFGIKGVDRSQVTGKHVMGDIGKPIYDDKFTMSGTELSVVASGALVKALCKICYAFQSNKQLVAPGGADCFPRRMYQQLKLYRYKECQNLTEPNYANKQISLSMIGLIHRKIKWMAMAFESTTYTGKSAFQVADDYNNWENFTKHVLEQPDIPEMLKSGFQTSYSWVNMFSEIIAVNGAIYGIVMSLIMCLASVVVFTGNFRLSMIVFVTIGGALSLVVAFFYFIGWRLGAIEAISLSILVGTSVDYTIHITEGYVMASTIEDLDGMTNKEIRFKRVRLALSHIGVSIFSSALTTLIAAIPLCLTSIRLFSKFGEILAINTGVSILYTLTICESLQVYA